MGRRPINGQPISVRLTPGQRARIEDLVGNYRTGVFIRDAVEAELVRREKGTAPTETASPPIADQLVVDTYKKVAKLVRQAVDAELRRQEQALVKAAEADQAPAKKS
jgi:hypothetical protein